MTDFTIDTPATVGDLQSWSVTESATQASPVEPVRGTPSFSAVAKRTDKTKFATHNGASLTHDKLGTIDGYVRSVNPVGTFSHLDCQTVLNQLNVDAEFSETFFPEGLLSDYVKQLVGVAVTNPPAPPPALLSWAVRPIAARNWSSITYGNGVFVAVGTDWTATSTDGETWTLTNVSGVGAFVAYGNGVFVALGNGTVAVSANGIAWTKYVVTSGWNSITFGNGLFVAVRQGGTPCVMTSPDGITWTLRTTPNGNWNAITYGNGLFVAAQFFSATVMRSTDGVTWTTAPSPMGADWRSITYANGIFVAVGTGTNPVMTSPDGLIWSSRAAPNSNWYSVAYGGGTFVAVSYSAPYVMTSQDGGTWTATDAAPIGAWRSIVAANSKFVVVGWGSTNYAMTRVFGVSFTNWQSTTNPVVTFIPWRGNIWQMLNSLLMLHGVEMVYSGGQMVVRDIGSHVITIDNATVFNRTISAVDARQSVDVAYREAFAQTGTTYDAYVDGNKAYRIEVNEYRQDKIVYEVPIRQWSLELNAMRQIGTITNVPTELNQPTEAATGTKKPVAGQFVISDNEGKALPKGQFFGYGGSMKVSLNPVDPFSFYLTWRGPSTEIPDHPGPYSIQVGEQGCFSVTGDAIFAYDKTVNVRTGADPAKVTDATPLALNVPFVNSKYQAFEVGAAAGAELCSSTDELSFDIATNALEGFGVTPGSIFRYDNVNWRIVTCDIHGATTSITARYHTTYADFDAAWDGKTFDDFDAAWAGYKFKDFGIEPLRTA